MVQRWPQLTDVRITHAWNGYLAFTFDYLPHMGTLEGLHYAGGCQGSGVAMLSWLGHMVARKILGGANRVCAFDGRELQTRPFYSGDPWFLPAVGAWYRYLDRRDRARSERKADSAQ
jgi:glycine/D-amino acid oxidase-like deaminating enzyme